MEHIINPVYYQDFILAGSCEFNVRSLRTKSEEIFVVNRTRNGDRFYFVNNRVRENLGKIVLIRADENIWVFEQKTRGIMVAQADSIKKFSWLWRQIMLGDKADPSFKEIQILNPYNRCAHCHRLLTHPESIPIGIGPDCFKKLGLTHKTLVNV